MKKAKIPSFTKKQQQGILALIMLIVFSQFCYFLYKNKSNTDVLELTDEQKIWLASQKINDSLKLADTSQAYKIYPFNPNFITEYKGYQLGMKLVEIERLHAFREQNKYVNSAQEFQQVTKVSDSVLNAIKPYFKFPDWVTNKKNKNTFQSQNYTTSFTDKFTKEEIQIKDFNHASVDDLMLLPGIGEAFANRIVQERDKYNGFMTINQIDDVWGLSPQAIQNVKKYFIVKDISSINKIKINEAAVSEISKLPYIRYNLARDIVIYRSKYGDFKSENELVNVSNFPADKIETIKLYIIF